MNTELTEKERAIVQLCIDIVSDCAAEYRKHAANADGVLNRVLNELGGYDCEYVAQRIRDKMLNTTKNT
jgi:hypothetical protein